MVLIIHGVKQSTCTQRVLLALEEKGVDYKLNTIDIFSGEHKTAAYKQKLQPFGKIPVLEDDGFFVYESRAIAKYIAAKYEGTGTKLMPTPGELKEYGLFEQACSLEGSYFNPAAEPIAFEKVFKIAKKLGPTDEKKVLEYLKSLEETLAVYETILTKQSYLAGNELTLADLYHLPYGSMAKKLGYNGVFEKFPHVDKWFSGLEARESWKKVTS